MNNVTTRRHVLLAGSAAGIAAVTPAAMSGSAKSAPEFSPSLAATAGGREVVAGSASPAFSRAVKFDKIVWVSGVLGHRPGTRELASPDFEPQARQVLENLKASVEAAGSRLDRVLKCGVFLTDVADFAAFNRIYVEFFPKDPPARSTVVVKELVAPGAKVEVDCVTCVE